MQKLEKVYAVIYKDFQIELRSKYALNTVLAFVVSSLLVVLFTLRAQALDPTPKSGLVWIIILFAALSSLSRSFVMETERNTFDLLRLHGEATSVFLGKLFYNYIFTLFVNITTFFLYIFLLDMQIASGSAFIITLLLGTAGLSGVATMLAAVVSQADRKGAIFSVLSLPLMIPLILILVRTTRAALIEGGFEGFMNDFFALTGYVGVTITAGILLFDYIWEE